MKIRRKYKRNTFFALLFLLPITASLLEKYPWLEQISRQDLLLKHCENMQLNNKGITSSQLDHILVDHRHKLLYCYVPKVACTNWKRVFMVLTGESNATNLVDIPAFLAHADNSTVRLSQLNETNVRLYLQEFTAFVMVRHPFERLLSAFRNKFEDSLPSSKYFQSRYGKHIIQRYRVSPKMSDLKHGTNVSFGEFVRYLINEGVETNEHWAPIYNLCLPCSVNYTFIGRYETLDEDTRTVLNMVGAPPIVFPTTRTGNTSDKLREYFQQLSIVDIQKLYQLYEVDFKLFGYGLENLLGYDLA